MNDLVIRGATIVDGLGNAPRRSTWRSRTARSPTIGNIKDGAKVIDAGGLTLAAGHHRRAYAL